MHFVDALTITATSSRLNRKKPRVPSNVKLVRKIIAGGGCRTVTELSCPSASMPSAFGLIARRGCQEGSQLLCRLQLATIVECGNVSSPF